LCAKREEGDNSGHTNLFGKGSDYSTEKFTYENEVYDNLFNLMYFNTSCARKAIFDALETATETLRKNPNKWKE